MESFMSVDDSEYRKEVAELNDATSAFSSSLGKRSRAVYEEDSVLPIVVAPGAWSPALSVARSRSRSSPRESHNPGGKATQFRPQFASVPQQISTNLRRIGGTSVYLHEQFSALCQNFWDLFRATKPSLEIAALEIDDCGRKRRSVPQMPSSPSNASPEVAKPPLQPPAPTGEGSLRARFERIERNHAYFAANKVPPAGSGPAAQTSSSHPIPQKKPAPVGLEPYGKKMQRMKKKLNRYQPRTAAEKDASVEKLASRAQQLTLTPLDDRDIPSSAKKDRRIAPEEEKRPESKAEPVTPEPVTPEPLPPEPQLIQPISQEWENKLAEAMETTSQTKSLAQTAEGIDLTVKDFMTLLSADASETHASSWLNDEIVNGFFAAIVEQKKTQVGWVKGTTAPYAAFNTSWYNNVRQRGIASIKTWSRRKQISQEKLLKAEKVFFPLNSGAHWLLIIISPQTKEIEVLDSMNGNPDKYFMIAHEWLEQELGKLYVESEWTESESVSCAQDNSDDCGAFACWNGLASAKGLSYSQVSADKMQDARRMMGAILLNGGFHGDFEL